MSEFTPWFDGKKHKPARKGVYQQKSLGGYYIGYQYWDGKKWGAFSSNPYLAYKLRMNKVNDLHQNDDWRGLAKNPDA